MKMELVADKDVVELSVIVTFVALQKFFSNDLLNEERDGSASGMLYFHGSHFYGEP